MSDLKAWADRDLVKRYLNDPTFYRIVQSNRRLLREGQATEQDLRDALELAIAVEERESALRGPGEQNPVEPVPELVQPWVVGPPRMYPGHDPSICDCLIPQIGGTSLTWCTSCHRRITRNPEEPNPSDAMLDQAEPGKKSLRELGW